MPDFQLNLFIHKHFDLFHLYSHFIVTFMQNINTITYIITLAHYYYINHDD